MTTWLLCNVIPYWIVASILIAVSWSLIRAAEKRGDR